jgi:hypothetical protein
VAANGSGRLWDKLLVCLACHYEPLKVTLLTLPRLLTPLTLLTLPRLLTPLTQLTLPRLLTPLTLLTLPRLLTPLTLLTLPTLLIRLTLLILLTPLILPALLTLLTLPTPQEEFKKSEQFIMEVQLRHYALKEAKFTDFCVFRVLGRYQF